MPDWFGCVEAADRIWVYNGSDDLILYEVDGKESRLVSMDLYPDAVPPKVPAKLSERIPHLMGEESSQ